MMNNRGDDDVVIVSAVRTPMCRSRNGALVGVPPSVLLQTVLEATLSRNSNLSGKDIEDICVGNVLMPPSGYAAMRMAHICAGIPAETCSLSTVNRQCSSGLEAVANIAKSIANNEIAMGIGAGVESMSTYAMNSVEPPPMDWDRVQSSQTAMDCLLPMGITSENVAKEYGLRRSDLDQFAASSHEKAAAATKNGKFQNEIVPVAVVSPDDGTKKWIKTDDGIRPDTTPERLSKLKPAFDKERGITTAGNSSQTTDGAAAVLLMKRREARRRNLPVLGIWRGYAVRGCPPRIMGIGPAVAIPAACRHANVPLEEIDVFEINEAFASQATWCVDELRIAPEKVNPNGGAIALGHPLGCTGARLIATLLNELHREKKRFGVVSMCIGTGMGAAAILEVEPSSSL